jgi:hypothetical protein
MVLIQILANPHNDPNNFDQRTRRPAIEEGATNTGNCLPSPREAGRGKGEGSATDRSAAITAGAPHPSLSPLPRGEGDQPQRFTTCSTIERHLAIQSYSFPYS